MADFYVDVVNGLSANAGTQLAPKQYISEVTMSANNRIYLRRGQTHPISNYRFFLSGQSMDAYGDGPLPILQKAAGPDAWIYIRNADGVTIKNVLLDGNGFGGPILAVANTAASQAVTNFLLENLELYGSINNSGLYIAGLSGSTVRSGVVKNCKFYNNYSHGTLCSTDVQNVRYEYCTSRSNGYGVGAHGFSAWAVSASPAPSRIVWFECIAEDIIDFDGIEGQGFQADDNSSYVTAIGCIARRCGGYGFLSNESDNNIIVGSIAHDNDGPGFGCTGASTGVTFANNTSYGNALNAGTSAELQLSGNSTGATIINNILDGRSRTTYGMHVGAGAVSGTTARNNCVYGVTTEASGITPTNSVLSDPLLDASYRPRAGSPCINAGTLISSPPAYDFFGKEVLPSPTIGAVQIFAARSAMASRAAMTRSAASRDSFPRRAAYG